MFDLAGLEVEQPKQLLEYISHVVHVLSHLSAKQLISLYNNYLS